VFRGADKNCHNVALTMFFI